MNSVTAVAKDMGGGGSMSVCAEEVPFTALKVTTDLVDDEITTEEEFVTNHNTSNKLSEGILSLVHELKDFERSNDELDRC